MRRVRSLGQDVVRKVTVNSDGAIVRVEKTREDAETFRLLAGCVASEGEAERPRLGQAET